MVGSFLPSASLRSLAWSIDGIGLILAGALLVVYYLRKGDDGTAAGFLIFTIGEALILSSSGVNLDADVTSFGAGAGLWAASLAVISFQKNVPHTCAYHGIHCCGFVCHGINSNIYGKSRERINQTVALFRLSIFCSYNFWVGLEADKDAFSLTIS